MHNLFLRVHIDPISAIQSGCDLWGPIDLPVLPSVLSEAQRHILASLTVAHPERGVLLLPTLQRGIASVIVADIPSLLDEVATERDQAKKEAQRVADENDRVAKEHERTMRAAYAKWRPAFLAIPMGPNEDELVVDGRSLYLPQKVEVLVKFDVAVLTASDRYAPKAKVESIRDLACDILCGENSTWNDHFSWADVEKVESWVASDAIVMARIVDANGLRDKLTSRVESIFNMFREAIRAEEAAATAAEAAAAEETVRLRKETLATWVTQFGTALQKKRFAAHLMADEEVIAAISDQAFEPLAELAVYQPISAEELESAAESEGRYSLVGTRITYAKYKADSATDAEFALMESMQKKVPDAVIELMEDLAYYAVAGDEHDPEVRRKKFRVQLKTGQFSLHREYRAD